jgi:hypothetical protein
LADTLQPLASVWRPGEARAHMRILYEAQVAGYARCRVGNILFGLIGWWSLARLRLCEGPQPCADNLHHRSRKSELPLVASTCSRTNRDATAAFALERGLAAGQYLSGRLSLRRSIMVQALLIIGACTFAGAGLAATFMLERV